MEGSSSRKAITAARRKRALELRIQGKSLAVIAEELGISVPAVSKLIRTAMEATAKEIAGNADELRALEVERIDRLLDSLWERATESHEAYNPIAEEMETVCPELGAVDRVVRLMERRAKLLGIDKPPSEPAPEKTESAVKVSIYLPDNGRRGAVSD